MIELSVIRLPRAEHLVGDLAGDLASELLHRLALTLLVRDDLIVGVSASVVGVRIANVGICIGLDGALLKQVIAFGLVEQRDLGGEANVEVISNGGVGTVT